VDSILVILLVVAAIKFVFFGIILYFVFRPELRKGARRKAPTTITCMYCQSKWTRPVDEGQTRWEDDDLVLVTTYECQHCHLPFWHVERVPVGSLKR
jgi:hypothetical protein